MAARVLGVSACSSAINRKGLVYSAVNNNDRILSANEKKKRAHLNTFVKIIIGVSTKRS